MDVVESFQTLAISLGLGMLVGLQREHAESRIAGIRTFPLITLLGTLCGLLSGQMGSWLVAMGMVGVIAASGLGNYLRNNAILAGTPPPEGKTGSGITTEMAILVMYAVGVFLAFGPAVIAIAVTGAVVLLLHAKQWLHQFVDNLGEKDVHGIMQFVLLAFVILPVLPDETFGPFGVLNPRRIWMVVVLVVGISLGGYVLYKIVGERAGAVLSGLLGGLISSTATTVSFARRAREVSAAGNGNSIAAVALVILLASTVLYARIFIELSAVASKALPIMAWPIAALAMVSVVLCFVMFIAGRRKPQHLPEQKNPTQLKSAFFFAGAYAIVLLAVAAGQEHLGGRSIYAVAAISGMTDMDAITLSAGQLVTDGKLDASRGWKAIVVAIIANMVFKTVVCGVLGGRRLCFTIAAMFSVKIVAAVAIIGLWPS